MTLERSFDSREFRRVCGHFLSGVTIVTTRRTDGAPVGLTANAFLSVSLDPPLVLVSVDKRTDSHPAIAAASTFIVHILGEGQDALSTRFARHGEDKFSGLVLRDGLGGAPVLPEHLARLECVLTAAHEAGDHTLFIGRVEHIVAPAEELFPLGYYRGSYVRVERREQVRLPKMANELWALGWA